MTTNYSNIPVFSLGTSYLQGLSFPGSKAIAALIHWNEYSSPNADLFGVRIDISTGDYELNNPRAIIVDNRNSIAAVRIEFTDSGQEIRVDAGDWRIVDVLSDVEYFTVYTMGFNSSFGSQTYLIITDRVLNSAKDNISLLLNGSVDNPSIPVYAADLLFDEPILLNSGAFTLIEDWNGINTNIIIRAIEFYVVTDQAFVDAQVNIERASPSLTGVEIPLRYIGVGTTRVLSLTGMDYLIPLIWTGGPLLPSLRVTVPQLSGAPNSRGVMKISYSKQPRV